MNTRPLSQVSPMPGVDPGTSALINHWPQRNQGCQMVSFQTKNTNLGMFWRTLEWQMLISILVIGIFTRIGYI
jgi:hypothetical protein